MREPEVNDRVRIVPKHWARGRQLGTIRQMDSSCRYLVEFDKPGVGFSIGKHQFLFLDANDFVVVENA